MSDNTLKTLETITNKYIQLANKLYKIDLKCPTIVISKLGTAAGKAYYKLWEIRYNIKLVNENLDEYLCNTIPHEVAHLVEWSLHGKATHLKNWKKIMKDFGVDKPKSYHTYNVQKCKRSLK